MREQNRWTLYRSGMMIGIILLAIAYEQASAERLAVLLLVGAGLVLMGMIRGRIARQKLRALSFLIDGLLLIVLETYSRYAINLALQGVTILLIVDSYRYLEKRLFLRVGIGISILGMVKFVQHISLGANFLVLSQTLFIAMVHILVLTTLWFSRSYQDEKTKIEAANRQIEQLSRERERTRLARELHDSMGHSLTALIMQLEIVKRTEKNLSESGKTSMDEAVSTARQTLSEVRSVVDTLKEEASGKDFQTMLNEMIESFQERTEIQVEMQGLDDLPDFYSKKALDLYRIVQESLTNTARHGHAHHVKIEWCNDGNRLVLHISDDGIGIKNLVMGNGLTGMQTRVERLNGEISFHGENGFATVIQIPLRG